MTVQTPQSQTDPYAPEPSETQKTLVTLVGRDNVRVQLASDARVMDRHALIQHAGKIYSFRCDDQVNGKWTKIYRECVLIELSPVRK